LGFKIEVIASWKRDTPPNNPIYVVVVPTGCTQDPPDAPGAPL
jgi:hypothetical protein